MANADEPTKPAVPRAIAAVPSAQAKTASDLLATGDWTGALAELVSEVKIVRANMGDVGQFLSSGTKLIGDVQRTVDDVRSSIPPASGELAPRPSLAAKAAKATNVWGHRLAVAIALASIAAEFIAARYPHETGPLGAIIEIVHVLTARQPAPALTARQPAPALPSSGTSRAGTPTLATPDAGQRDEWSPPP